MPVGGIAKELITNLSPQRLLTSLAPNPAPCRKSSSLSSVWESAGLSTFELLLPYLSMLDQDATFATAVPSLVTLDLLHACLVHLRAVDPFETSSDSLFLRSVYSSTRFAPLLAESISQTLSLSRNSNLRQMDKSNIFHGLLSLRVLGTCVEISPTIADSVLRLQSESLVPSLIEAASKTRDLISSNQIFENEQSIVQMRVATGCLFVLSSLWKTAGTNSPDQSDSTGARLAKVIDGQTTFITDLVTVISKFANDGNLEAKIAPSRESGCARCTMITYTSIALDVHTSGRAG